MIQPLQMMTCPSVVHSQFIFGFAKLSFSSAAPSELSSGRFFYLFLLQKQKKQKVCLFTWLLSFLWSLLCYRKKFLTLYISGRTASDVRRIGTLFCYFLIFFFSFWINILVLSQNPFVLTDGPDFFPVHSRLNEVINYYTLIEKSAD